MRVREVLNIWKDDTILHSHSTLYYDNKIQALHALITAIISIIIIIIIATTTTPHRIANGLCHGPEKISDRILLVIGRDRGPRCINLDNSGVVLA